MHYMVTIYWSTDFCEKVRQAKCGSIDLSFELRPSSKYQGERVSESSAREEEEKEEEEEEEEEEEDMELLLLLLPPLSYVWSCMSTCKSTKRSTFSLPPCCCA